MFFDRLKFSHCLEPAFCFLQPVAQFQITDHVPVLLRTFQHLHFNVFSIFSTQPRFCIGYCIVSFDI